MKNHTTYETARALKEAGFPQPEPEFGQVWYDNDGYAFICLDDGYMVSSPGTVFCPGDLGDMFYAATVTDILREIELYFQRMPGYSVEISLTPLIGEFVCRVFEDLPFDGMKPIQCFDVNPAEACASAYL